MDIQITWTKIIVSYIAYQILRYLFHTYMKWTTGCHDVLDPTIPFDAAMIARDEYREITWKLRDEREKNEQQKLLIQQLQAGLSEEKTDKRCTKKA